MAASIPDLNLSHPWDLSPERAIELATECEAAALEYDSRIDNSEGATLGTSEGVSVYGNSHGFMGSCPATSHSLSCVVLGTDDAGHMQRDYWYTAARSRDGLESGVDVGKRAGKRTVDRLGARKISTRKAPVLYPAELARGLLGHFVTAVRGSSQYRKSSFLLAAAGETVFPEFLSVIERPHLRGAMGSAAFDDEGVATLNRDLVDRGKLTGYVMGSYSARKLGLETTGNAGGVHNLIVSDRGRGFDDLLADMGTGLLVTELMGQGVNPVTGDYSRGAAGFWVSNGAIDYPVHEITIAGNLKDMYRNLVDTGSDIDVRGGIRSGSMLIEEMTVAGE